MMLKQVSAETEGGTIGELTIDDATEEADPVDELENDDDDHRCSKPAVTRIVLTRIALTRPLRKRGWNCEGGGVV